MKRQKNKAENQESHALVRAVARVYTDMPGSLPSTSEHAAWYADEYEGFLKLIHKAVDEIKAKALSDDTERELITHIRWLLQMQMRKGTMTSEALDASKNRLSLAGSRADAKRLRAHMPNAAKGREIANCFGRGGGTEYYKGIRDADVSIRAGDKTRDYKHYDNAYGTLLGLCCLIPVEYTAGIALHGAPNGGSK